MTAAWLRDNIPRIQFVIEKIFLPKRRKKKKINLLISKADAYTYGFL